MGYDTSAGVFDEMQLGAVEIDEVAGALPPLLQRDRDEPRDAGHDLGHAARAHGGEELVEIGDAYARHEPALVRVVLGGEEELEHHRAATKDEPSAVVVRGLEAEAAVERGRRLERPGRKVGHRTIRHVPEPTTRRRIRKEAADRDPLRGSPSSCLPEAPTGSPPGRRPR